MSEIKTELLPSGVEFRDDNNVYLIIDSGDEINVTKSDIARMYGIAFPEKRRSGECYNVPEQADVPDINVGDMPLTTTGDKYEENVRKVAEWVKNDDELRHPNSIIQTVIEDYYPYARIAVRLQAEAFREAYLLSYGLLVADERLNNMLIERGLIPAQEVKESCEFKPCAPTNENPIGHPKGSLRILPTSERTFHCNVCGWTIKDPENKIHL